MHDDTIDDFIPPVELLDSDESLTVVLNPRQQVFVDEYLIDLSASQAALRSGYAPSAGSALLSHPAIAAAVQVAKAQRLTRVKMTQDQVLHELSLLSHSSIDHYKVNAAGDVWLADGAPRGAMRAVQSIERAFNTRTTKDGDVIMTCTVRIKLWDKPTPLKLMGKHVGLFPDRVEHTGKDGQPIETVNRIENVIVDPKPEEQE